MRFLLPLFIIIPLTEVGLFITVGDWIGLWPTIGLILTTAFIGVSLLKAQGRSTLIAVQAALSRNELPVSHLAEGMLLVMAGALLITPGFLTDAIGFTFLVPSVRRAVAARMLRRMVVVRAGGKEDPHPADPTIIEGTWEPVDTPDGPPDPHSPWRGPPRE